MNQHAQTKQDYDFYPNRPKPKNHDCAAALIVRDGKILMGLREYQKGNPVWTFPGGRCELGEKPEDGLRRETIEEIGITDLDIVKLLGKKKGMYRDETGVDVVSMFKCTTHQDPQLCEPEKFLEWRWLDPNDLPKNLIDVRDIEFIRMAL